MRQDRESQESEDGHTYVSILAGRSGNSGSSLFVSHEPANPLESLPSFEFERYNATDRKRQKQRRGGKKKEEIFEEIATATQFARMAIGTTWDVLLSSAPS